MRVRPHPTELSALPREDHICWPKIEGHTLYPAQVGSQVHAATCTPRIHIKELQHPQESWISMAHKSLKVGWGTGRNQTGNPRCQKGQKKIKGVRETTSRRAQRGQGHLHHRSQNTQTPSVYKPEPAAWLPQRRMLEKLAQPRGWGPPHGIGGWPSILPLPLVCLRYPQEVTEAKRQ